MAKRLPARPHLDHLRRQAKDLLAALRYGDTAAAATLREHLPAARGMTDDGIRGAGFRLADAQAAVARKTGFAGWPHLARHVDTLRALEGTWAFAHLEIDGQVMPPGMTGQSRLLIDGDRFRTESPESTYEGVFNIDVEADPHAIDIEFVAGPEAGNRNLGIFRLEGDQLDLCPDENGRPRPADFRTAPGSGHAYERLTRASAARPEGVTGGTPPTDRPEPPAVCSADPADFAYVEGPTLVRLQGEWAAIQVILDGKELPAAMAATGVRLGKGNEVRVTFGGQTMLHALVRVDDRADPVRIDYLIRRGPATGQVQRGILEWAGDEVCIVMAGPGRARPAAFASPDGSGITLSRWRPKRTSK
jgi:uncharacterized protein (TIGR03067 family)